MGSGHLQCGPAVFSPTKCLLQIYKHDFKYTREPETGIAKDKNVIARHHVEYSPCAFLTGAGGIGMEGERGGDHVQ